MREACALRREFVDVRRLVVVSAIAAQIPDAEIVGETRSFGVQADSGNINTRHFCPQCGGRLFGENSARPGLVGISVGALDDNSWFRAQRVVYAKDRPAWDTTPTDVPNFDMMPPPPPAK